MTSSQEAKMGNQHRRNLMIVAFTLSGFGAMEHWVRSQKGVILIQP